MKKKLFNIHRLIGINIVLFFFVYLFFGILTIFQPYVNIWENTKMHIKEVNIENINLNKCFNQVRKRSYFGEKGEKLSNDLIKFNFPSKEVKANNLINIYNRPNFYLDPKTCKKVRIKAFTISKFFDSIHTGGGIFNSIFMKILFGFSSVAIVFLCLSGLLLIIRNSYKNKKTNSPKTFFAKYHRLILLYTLPLVLIFGVTGALFNLGVYSSPVITSYLSDGKTMNILSLDRNILVDPDLEIIKASQKVKSIKLNDLYLKAKKEFEDIVFYEMEVYNYNDINARVKFIGYEPKNIFISSVGNETYVVLNGNTAEVIDKKTADQGTFAEKTLDALFYLHYLRTFDDIPRVIFAFICMGILFGIVCSVLLWMKRSAKGNFSTKVMKPLIFTIIVGSILSSSLLFLTSWIIPKSYLYFSYNETLYYTQELLFYFTYVFVFIYILFKKSFYRITKHIVLLSGILFISSVIAHDYFSSFTMVKSFNLEIWEVFYTDLSLIIVGLLLIYSSYKLKEELFEENKTIDEIK